MRSIPKISWRNFPSLLGQDAPHQLLSLAKQYGDIVQINSSPNILLTTNPNMIEHIMKKNVDHYSKNLREYHRLSALFADGLLTTMGPSWLEQRRAIQSLFHSKALQNLIAETVIFTEKLLQRWEWFAKYNEPLNIVPELLSLVLQISMKFLFHETLSHQHAEKLAHHFAIAQRYMLKAITLNPKIPTPGNLFFQFHRHKIQRYTQQLIQQRRKQPETERPIDLLSLLLTLRKGENQLPLKESTIIGEMITFMGTGHETTGSALCWTLFCLAKEKKTSENLADEANYIFANRAPAYDDIANIPYSKQVIQESLRLYPTIWSFARYAMQEDVINDITIPAKTSIVISPYVMHHLPEFWQDPERFLPERFSEENIRAQTRFAYIPFGVGPHICIANTFAIMKMQIILSMVMQRYQFELLPESEHIPFEPLISLRPGKPIRFRIRKRNLHEKNINN